MPRIAIVGAGLSGLTAARQLADQGYEVTVFEKSRGTGGRMSTRRVDGGSFDHGAQYFTVRDPDFQKHVDEWMKLGLVALWPDAKVDASHKLVVLKDGQLESEPAVQNRYVAVPAMNSICKHLAKGIQIHKQTRVETVTALRSDNKVELFDDKGTSLSEFDQVVISAPAEQTADLLSDGFVELIGLLRTIEMHPCWATMVAFERPITDQWVGAFLHNSFLTWAARNSTKPERNTVADHLILHAANDWTRTHWEDDSDEVATKMLKEFWRVSGLGSLTTTHLKAHRWKYAIPAETHHDAVSARCFADSAERPLVIACGDWACGGRVEGAFLSGAAAAKRILKGN